MKLKRFALILPAALLFLFGICGSPPNVPDEPWGPVQGMAGVPYACSTQTTDPDGGQVSYQFDWGDGNSSAWSAMMDGGQPYGDTHTYETDGRFEILSRAKTSSGKASDWSDEFAVSIAPGEGRVRWSFTYTDPEEHEEPDSADFSLYTFGIGPDGTACIGCEGYGAFIGRPPTGRPWEKVSIDEDDFALAPAIGDDGTIYVACADEKLYVFNPDGTNRGSPRLIGGIVCGPPAIGTDGTLFFQTEDDSVVALKSDGTRLWAFNSGGGISSPVIGTDGTVYVANDDGWLYALDPTTGDKKREISLGGQSINASPAIDIGRGVIYVVNDDGWLSSIALSDLSENWQEYLGDEPSSPVIGTDGTIYIGAGPKLLAVNPDDGDISWTFVPPLEGVVSTPAVSVDGCIYILVTAGKKDLQDEVDSLYAVEPTNARRWACGLGLGYADDVFSAPKIGGDGSIYVASGLAAWCVGGVGGPAQSSWPMFQHDAQNSGRAR